MGIIPKTSKLHPNTERGEGVNPSKYLKTPEEVCAYSSTLANTMVTTIKVARFLVFMCDEDQRHKVDTKTRPKRNRKGIRV
jgi:hypothetical protein